MGWNQMVDFIDLDPDPHSSKFVDPDPHTINADPHHWIFDQNEWFDDKSTHIPCNKHIIYLKIKTTSKVNTVKL